VSEAVRLVLASAHWPLSTHGPLPLPKALSAQGFVSFGARLGAGVVVLLCMLHLGIGHAASAANYPGGETLRWLHEHPSAAPGACIS